MLSFTDGTKALAFAVHMLQAEKVVDSLRESMLISLASLNTAFSILNASDTGYAVPVQKCCSTTDAKTSAKIEAKPSLSNLGDSGLPT